MDTAGEVLRQRAIKNKIGHQEGNKEYFRSVIEIIDFTNYSIVLFLNVIKNVEKCG